MDFRLKPRICAALVAIFIGNAPWTWAQEQFRFAEDPRFNGARQTAAYLLREFPPESHMIVGLGRTTGVTSAWIEHLMPGENAAAYVKYSPVENLAGISDMTQEQADRVWSYILPSPQELNGRRLVIHRILFQGKTVAKTAESLLSYMSRNGYKMPVEFSLGALSSTTWSPLQDPKFEGKIEVTSANSYVRRQMLIGYMSELEYENGRGLEDKLINYGSKTAATPEQLLENKGFANQAYDGLFKAAMQANGCANALSHFSK